MNHNVVVFNTSVDEESGEAAEHDEDQDDDGHEADLQDGGQAAQPQLLLLVLLLQPLHEQPGALLPLVAKIVAIVVGRFPVHSHCN